MPSILREGLNYLPVRALNYIEPSVGTSGGFWNFFWGGGPLNFLYDNISNVKTYLPTIFNFN